MCLVKGSKIDKDWKTAKNHHLPFNRQKFLKKSKNIVESLKNVVPFFVFKLYTLGKSAQIGQLIYLSHIMI